MKVRTTLSALAAAAVMTSGLVTLSASAASADVSVAGESARCDTEVVQLTQLSQVMVKPAHNTEVAFMGFAGEVFGCHGVEVGGDTDACGAAVTHPSWLVVTELGNRDNVLGYVPVSCAVDLW